MNKTALTLLILLAGLISACQKPKEQNPGIFSTPAPIVLTLTADAYGGVSWVRSYVPRYSFDVRIPDNWIIQELVRTSDTSVSVENRPCPEYLTRSLDGHINVIIRPQCNPGSIEEQPCPSSAEIIKELGEGRYILRYIDPFRPVYVYTEAKLQKQGKNGLDNLVCQNPPGLVVGEKENTLTFSVELNYTGKEDGRKKALWLADQIASSLRVR